MLEDRWLQAKARMIEHLPAMRPPAGPFSFSASYEAQSTVSAEQLAAWWRSQPDVAVRIVELKPTDWRDFQRRVADHGPTGPGSAVWIEFRDQRAWRVEIEGPRTAELTAQHVERWFAELAAVPVASGCQLTGVGLLDNWPGPDAEA